MIHFLEGLAGLRRISEASRPVLGPTQSPVQWVLGVKRPGREADNSSHLAPREWRYSSTSSYLFKGIYLYLFIR